MPQLRARRPHPAPHAHPSRPRPADVPAAARVPRRSRRTGVERCVRMVAYIIRRLVLLPITIFGVTVLIFLMLQLLSPVERSALYVRDIPHTEGALDAVIRRYGLADPMPVQYW